MKEVPAICLAVLLAAPRLAVAQPSTPPDLFPRVDVSASLGWYSASEELAGEPFSWYGESLSRNVGAVFYWTEHLVTAVEAGWTGEGELYGQHPDASPASLSFGSAEHTFRTRTVAVVQRYQFGHNAWFHPYVSAGALLEWVDHGGELGPLFGRNGTVVQPGRPIPPSTERRARALVTSGFKAYLTERAFVRPELRVGVTRQVEQVLVIIGLGIDF